VGFVVDEVPLRRVFSEYFGFPCQSILRRMLHTDVSSGAGTTAPLVTDVPSGLSVTPFVWVASRRCKELDCVESDGRMVVEQQILKEAVRI
jgi:hypothetical protein